MLETLAMSSVLITALCLIRMARGRVSARLIYSLWLVAALRLMLPFSLAPSPVSAMNLGGLVTEVAAPQAEAFSGDTAYEARPQAPAELTLPDAEPGRDDSYVNTAPAPAGGTAEYIPASDGARPRRYAVAYLARRRLRASGGAHFAERHALFPPARRAAAA